MENGTADAFSLNNPMFVGKKAKNYIWTKSIFYTKDVVVSLKNKPIKYTKPSDLFGKTIGKSAGNKYGELDKYFANGKIKAADVSKPRQLWRMLDAGRTDGFLGNVSHIPYAMKQAGVNPSNYYWSSKPLFEFHLMCQINKKQTQFQKDLNAFISKSKSNGFLKRIERQWLR